MAKQNAFLAKMEAMAEARCRAERRFTLQQCADMLLIAANEEFGFGPDRLRRLLTAYQTAWNEYASMVIEDSDSDRSIEYTRAKTDEKLRQICGEWFQPWEERYE